MQPRVKHILAPLATCIPGMEEAAAEAAEMPGES